jgi:hypothetical protein
MNNEQNDNNNSSMNQPTKDQKDLSISSKQLSNGFVYTKVTNNNTLSKRRKLILHFDNRNTLQVNLDFYFH